MAAEIARRCQEVAEECLSPEYIEAAAVGDKKLRPKLKVDLEDDADCALFIAHGPSMTKVTQRYMIDRLGRQWSPCPKVNLLVSNKV